MYTIGFDSGMVRVYGHSQTKQVIKKATEVVGRKTKRIITCGEQKIITVPVMSVLVVVVNSC